MRSGLVRQRAAETFRLHFLYAFIKTIAKFGRKRVLPSADLFPLSKQMEFALLPLSLLQWDLLWKKVAKLVVT